MVACDAPLTSVPMRTANFFWELNGLDLVEGTWVPKASKSYLGLSIPGLDLWETFVRSKWKGKS